MRATVRQLREALERVPEMHQDTPVHVWLPGTRIELEVPENGHFHASKGAILVEGNVRSGGL